MCIKRCCHPCQKPNKKKIGVKKGVAAKKKSLLKPTKLYTRIWRAWWVRSMRQPRVGGQGRRKFHLEHSIWRVWSVLCIFFSFLFPAHHLVLCEDLKTRARWLRDEETAISWECDNFRRSSPVGASGRFFLSGFVYYIFCPSF